MSSVNKAKSKRKKKISAAKKKKRITLAVVIVLAVCAVTIIVLYLADVIRFQEVETVVNNKTGVAYVTYAEQDMIINSEGKVLEKTEARPEDIPQLTGIEFTKIAEGSYLEYESSEAFEYAVKLVMALRENDIQVREININADMEASAYVNKVTIMFGTDEKTEIKASDLADFFDQVKDLKGTLHMETVNDKLGYTFKQETENTAIVQEQTETNANQEETEQEGAAEEVVQEENYEEPVNNEGEVQEEQNYEEPVNEEEVYVEPVNEEPVNEEPVYEEPVNEEPVNEEPVYEEPVNEEY